MNNRVTIALLLAIAASLCLGGSAQGLSREECTSTATALSEDDVVRELTPCASGATAACCEAGQKWAGFRDGAPLAGCLCYPELLDQVVTLAEGNAQARAFGVDREFITGLLQECGTPYAGGTGAAACPASYSNGGSDSGTMDSGMMANGGMMEGTQEEYTGAKPMTVQGGGGGMMSSSTDEGDKGEGDKGEGDEVPPPPPPPKGGDDEGSDSGKGGCDGGWWDGCEDHPLADWEERRERRGKWFAHPLGR